MAVTPGPRVLSMKQPWAWAIVSGLKHVENRSWKTPYRGTVYIHASRQPDPWGMA
jgi:ASCH domain